MKKHLLIGLTILIGTNLAALGGVVYNQMSDATAQLTLTERELSLPYNSGAQKENSGISLSINWRTPTGENETYYPYNSRDVKLTIAELLALGFAQTDIKDNYWVESRELYWAFEFDGALHKAEIIKAEDKYQAAIATYEEQPNDTSSRKKNEYSESLEREKTNNSRLFFIEASADYESLADKFSGQKNILIVKGLAKPYYNNDKTYSLMLKHLSVSNIMVPLEYSDALSHLKRVDRRDITPPRYAVDISWGSRLEPWITNINKTEE
ncbi:DUF4824 family protein [Colwellia psychrerythraea]|uniref:DUF4824 domain-containing protein n=1 Tax=Colwellia psychrerythraea TaxID=28229 RepID=A0A099L4U6_COLPS|nr:DUF4824 family protein [Colwellia psychrerythraea]KGJ96908.1 hypothetical protein GAB14E_1376 [Colwellia psychrerythraea]